MKYNILKEKPSFSGSGIRRFNRDCRYLESMVWSTKDGLLTEIRPMHEVFGWADSIWMEGEVKFTNERELWEAVIQSGNLYTLLSLLAKQSREEGRDSLKKDLKELLS